MKHEWKKHEKDLYAAQTMPTTVTVPMQNFVMISGEGNPNLEDFSERVGVLMSLAYAIKMRHKAACLSDAGYAGAFAYGDYAVFPLEGIWASAGNPADKDNLIYTIMIRQPDFVTQGMFEAARSVVEKKKPHPLLSEVKYGGMEDGCCVQMLHMGPYDDEPASFQKMDGFLKERGLTRIDSAHREIYLSDARKMKPERLQTILRYRVK